MAPDEQQQTPGPAESYGFLLYLGVVIGGIGAYFLYHLSRQGPDVSDYARYGSIGAVLAGIIFCYLSSVPKAEAIAWLKSGVTALLVAFTFRWAVGEPYRIPSSSMEPTLHGDERPFRGDRVWVNKWWYGWKWPFTNTRIVHLHEPERWDIVVFNTAEKDAKHPVLVKRIVALPGERISIHDGMIHVNGEAIAPKAGMPENQYYERGGMGYGTRPEDKFAVVPAGHYLVCGDNSRNSRDGRYFGWLPAENIVGRVASVWWPIGRWQDFTGFTQTWWWRVLVGAFVIWTLVRLFIGRSYAAYARDGVTDHYWVSFIAYGLRIPFWGRYLIRWSQPKRGDLVLTAITGPGLPAGATTLARIAALPGERITITETNAILINDHPLPAAAWPSALAYSTGHATNAAIQPTANAIQLTGRQYYFLNDDPTDPEPWDSRIIGPIPRSAIAGRITALWWPLRRAKRIRPANP